MSDPLDRPAVRHGIGLGSGLVLAAIALLFLDGTVRQVALLIAAIDVLLTPRLLAYARKRQ